MATHLSGSAAAAPEHVPPNDSRFIDHQQDIVACLKQLRDRRLSLTIRLEGAKDAFVCKVLDVTDNTFLIDDITPRTGNQFLRKNRRISISARAEGTFVYIEHALILRGDAERGVPFFHVAIPPSMLFHQRRRSERFRIPMRVSAQGAIVSLFRGELDMTGRIIDISAGGLRAEFDLPKPWPVAIEDRFEHCAITVPGLLNIHSDVCIRHCHEPKRSPRFVCGMELTRMHVTDRRRLEQFIQTIAKNA